MRARQMSETVTLKFVEELELKPLLHLFLSLLIYVCTCVNARGPRSDPMS